MLQGRFDCIIEHARLLTWRFHVGMLLGFLSAGLAAGCLPFPLLAPTTCHFGRGRFRPRPSRPALVETKALREEHIRVVDKGCFLLQPWVIIHIRGSSTLDAAIGGAGLVIPEGRAAVAAACSVPLVAGVVQVVSGRR